MTFPEQTICVYSAVGVDLDNITVLKKSSGVNNQK
jgi:hypothetical protein